MHKHEIKAMLNNQFWFFFWISNLLGMQKSYSKILQSYHYKIKD